MALLLLLIKTFIFYPCTDTVLTLGQNDAGVVKFYLENNTSQTEVYKIELTTLEKPQDTYVQICVGGICRVLPQAIDTLNPQESDSILVEVYTGNDIGNLRLYLLVSNQDNPNDRDSTFITGAVTSIYEDYQISYKPHVKAFLRKGVLKVNLGNIKLPAEYEIISSAGNAVETGTFYTPISNLKVSSLKSGIYFIVIKQDNAIFPAKFIVWR